MGKNKAKASPTSSGGEDKPDLTMVTSLTEDDLTTCLRSRYLQDIIYTRIHDSIMVVVNPYKELPVNSDQTSLEYVSEYKDTSGQRNAPLPPHVYQLGNQAYLHMRRTGLDQSIVLSGESASGKTETQKLLVRHLVTLSSHKKESKVQNQVVNSQFVLETFGNAKTSANDNASRFAKYTEVQFNERGRMIGAKTLNYLLEKSRVTGPPQDERNFHAFYYLLSGASPEEKTQLRLGEWHTYHYLNSSKTSRVATIDDSANYNELKSAMKSLGLGKKYAAQISQLLSAILHLGNIQFVDDPNNTQDAAYVKNADVLDLVADFLGVDPRALENVLTYKTKMIKKDITTLFLNAEQAAVQRDDMARALYSLLFTWLVEHINTKLCIDNFANFIGILDLPGPQLTFANDAFEQFCVNFANERIHAHMQRRIFDRMTPEYQREGIVTISEVPHFSNAGCLELLVKPSSGIIAIMNEQASKPGRRTDDTMMDAFVKYNGAHASFTARTSDTGARLFAIAHFAGQVSYDPRGFLERNGDTLSADFVSLFRGGSEIPASYNPFVSGLFTEKAVATESHPRNEKSIVSAQESVKPMRSPSTRRPKKDGANAEDDIEEKDDPKSPTSATHKTRTSIALQLQSAMQELADTLEETTGWTVLCFRPNDSNRPNTFDSKRVKQQVRAYGVPEITRRLITEYTIGFEHVEFLERYAVILQPMGIEQSRDLRAKCEAAGTIFGWGSKEFVVGITKIYLNESAWRDLEDNLRNQDKDEQRRAKEERRTGEAVAAQSSLVELSSSRQGSGMLVPPAGPRNPYGDEQRSYYSEDARSFYSEDEYYQDDRHSGGYNDTESAYGSEVFAPSGSTFKEMEMRKMLNEDPKGAAVEDEVEEPRKMSRARKQWLVITWFLTWWIPGPFLRWCGGMKRPEVRMAWREKVALCIVIFIMSAIMIAFIAFFGKLICPYQNVFSRSELQNHIQASEAYTAIRGEVFDLTSFAGHHPDAEVIPTGPILKYGGMDSTDLFPVQVSALCNGITGAVSPAVTLDFHVNVTDPNAAYHDFRYFTTDYRPDWYWETMVYLRKNYRVGFMGYDPTDIYTQANTAVSMGGITTRRSWAILNNDIYDLTYYQMGGRAVRPSPGQQAPSGVDVNFMDQDIVDLFYQKSGGDITNYFNALTIDPAIKQRQLVCLRNLFFVGKVDTRNSPQCLFSQYLLLGITGLLCAVILFKFLAALQLTGRREPEEYDKFIICQVPCYTESEESLRKTIDSLSVLRYDDKRKLLFLIADGMIVGSGNDRPTPRIVLDILGVDPNVDPEPLSFQSLGDGMAQHNMAKIYSGLYECAGHVVPYIVVVKVGKPTERQKPGNRGKRDSQMIMMRFLNKVHFNSEMTPMELEIYHQIKNVIGVNPSFYEFVLMVDADTEVLPDSLNRMVSCFVHDAKIIGLCGETMLSNEKDTWVTMIQVYEYYISHHLAKAFESLFGSVTCLPGCFCMYRVRSTTKNQPLLISNEVILDYSENVVETLHMKNLLHLGEDRYLTTLILKHFPNYKTKFTPDAACKTNAPDRWNVLLSQRRRWINSTVHNLLELMFLPQLCGFCCFSMRFVVILDLFGTLVMPAVVCYLVYLIYSIIVSPDTIPLWSLVMLGAVYGLQALIFIIRRKWEHVGWMIVYICAIPISSFAIPIYAFWHFDDFSWGNTRTIAGEKGKKLHLSADEGKFDPKSIPKKKWTDYEQELWEVGSHESRDSRGTAHTGYTHESYRSHRSFAPAGVAPGSTAGSVYNDAASYYSGQGGNNGRSRSRSPAPMATYDNQSIRQQSFINAPLGGVPDPRMSHAYSDMMSQRGSGFMNRTPSEIDLAYANMPPPSVMSGMVGVAGSRPGSMMPPGGSGMDPYYLSGLGSSSSGDGTILPTDEEILQEIRRILSTADLMSITKKQVRDELSAFFGVDMSSRREYVNSCIEQVLQGKL